MYLIAKWCRDHAQAWPVATMYLLVHLVLWTVDILSGVSLWHLQLLAVGLQFFYYQDKYRVITPGDSN